MNKILYKFLFCLYISFLLCSCVESNNYPYTTVEGDPLNVRTYTLANGLKVFMSVSDDVPSVSASVVVKAGVRNETDGSNVLSHFIERIMYKGTDKLGVVNYQLEKPFLDVIEELSNQSKNAKTEQELTAIFEKLDSVSFEASKWSIPLDYHGLMSAIGAKESSAYSGYDGTIFSEIVPSNQIENWIKIQGERFSNTVIRGFFSEYAAIYEEVYSKNRSDYARLHDVVLRSLCPTHPYGISFLKEDSVLFNSISVTDLKDYIKTYYVPNNMSVVLSGDFDPDKVIGFVDKYFGAMIPNEDLDYDNKLIPDIVSGPIVEEVAVRSNEGVLIGWKLPGSNSENKEEFKLLEAVLYNGKAGLIDIFINQKQKAISASARFLPLYDCSFLTLSCYRTRSQTLDDSRDLLLEQINKLKKGDFEEDLILSTLNNLQLMQTASMERNQDRNSMIATAFIHQKTWEKDINKLDRYEDITKEDIVRIANKYLDDNHVIVYGKKKLDSPIEETPEINVSQMFLNRDLKSSFYDEIVATQVEDIQPKFINFEKDLSVITTESGLPLIYKQNHTNDIFNLSFVFDLGYNNLKELSAAFDYLKYLGTSDLSIKDINEQFYKIACSLKFDVKDDRFTIHLYGLNENILDAIKLLENLINGAVPDKEVYTKFVRNILRKRSQAKDIPFINFYKLLTYAEQGEDHPEKAILSKKELINMDIQFLIDIIHNIFSYDHNILYYGPSSESDILEILQTYHEVGPDFKPSPDAFRNVSNKKTIRNTVYVSHFPGDFAYIEGFSNRGMTYSPEIDPISYLYNEYFGQGDNSIVFQEIQESQGLTYQTSALLVSPGTLKENYVFRYYAMARKEKILEVLSSFDYIVRNMPESHSFLEKVKEDALNKIRAQRITKNDVLWAYLDMKRLGLNKDRRQLIYDRIPDITLDDIKLFHDKWVGGQPFTFCIVTDEESLDVNELSKYGKVEIVPQKIIFSY